MLLLLYSLRGCPFCSIVENKLRELGITYEINWINPFNRPKIVEDFGGSVPLIIDGSVTMAESFEILEYLENKYGRKK